MTTPSEPTGPHQPAKQLFWTGALGAVALVLWVVGIGAMLLGGPPPPPPGFAPPAGGPPPGMHPGGGWPVILCQMAIAATVLCGLTYLDYRRQGRDMQRDAEREARAEARHQEMMARMDQVAAESLATAMQPDRLAVVRDLTDRIASGPNGHNGTAHRARHPETS